MPETRELPARGGADDRIHAVDAADPDAALFDPSPYRARCGERVLEVYNDGRELTCPYCAGNEQG
jgi:hypothetical protein